MKLTTYLYNVAVAFDRVLAAFITSDPNETLSSIAYRKHRDGEPWGFMMPVINAIFWFQPGHCYIAYQHDRERKLKA